MAFIKEYKLNNGLSAPNAYHVIVKVDTLKRVCDDPDPDNIRPRNTPNYAWKSGYYGRMSVAVYASKEARENGSVPIGMKCVYPTGTPYGYLGPIETIEELNFDMNINSPLSDVEQAYQHLKTLDYYKDAVED